MYGGIPYAGGPYAGTRTLDADVPSQTAPTLAVEVAFTTAALAEPAWVDIAADVRSWDVARGRGRELERFQPGRATVVLSNLSRHYDAVNAAGPWYGTLKPMRRMRIRETFNGVTYPIFDGYVDKWVLDYPGSGHDATATIVATDGFKILARTDLPESVYSKVVADDAPQVYLKLDGTIQNLAENVVVNDGSLGAIGAFFRSVPEVGSQGLVVNDPGRSLNVPDTNTYDAATVAGVEIPATALSLLSNSVFTIEGWGRIREGATRIGSSVTGNFVQISPAGTNSVHGAVQYRDNGFGAERRIEWFIVIGGGASVYGVQSPFGSIVPGKIHHIVATVESGGQMVLYIDGTRYTNSTGFTGGNVSAATRPTGGRVTIGHDGTNSAGAIENWGGEIDNVAFYEGIALTQAQVTTHYQAGTHPWQDDLPGTRAHRIFDIVGIGNSLREVDTGLTPLQSATLNTTALEHLHKIAETEFGLLFVTAAGTVRLIGRPAHLGRQPATEIYGDGAGEVGYRGFAPDDGDAAIRNRAIISRLNGAARTVADGGSIADLGRFDYTLDGLYHREDAYSESYAQLIVDEYADPRRRIAHLDLGPADDGAEDVVYPAMLGRELADAVIVRSRPIGGGDLFEQTCAVEGIQHAGRPGGPRTTRLVLSPEFSFRDWEDVVQIGHADTSSGQSGISTTIVDLTSLSVAVTVAAARRIRITGSVTFHNLAAGANWVALSIAEGSTQLNDALGNFGATGTNQQYGTVDVAVVLTPSAGAHTYKLRAMATGASVNTLASATRKPFILVEDIGPA